MLVVVFSEVLSGMNGIVTGNAGRGRTRPSMTLLYHSARSTLDDSLKERVPQ
jgi:hypothetical protein